jgi:hypothetical protein
LRTREEELEDERGREIEDEIERKSTLGFLCVIREDENERGMRL